jgi:hypothetical protein
MKAGPGPMTRHDTIRLSWGAALLLAPDRCARLLAGTTLDPRARLVVRALGARHLAQGLAFSFHGTAPLRHVGRVVDLLHAGSMVLLAALAPGRERLALTDAVIEFALVEPAHGEPAHREATSQAASEAASVAPEPRSLHGADIDPGWEQDPALESADGALSRRQRNALLQGAVYDAYLDTQGQDPDQVRTALLKALSARALAAPPLAWQKAVVDELASGNLYVVSAPALDDIGVSAPGGKPHPTHGGKPR